MSRFLIIVHTYYSGNRFKRSFLHTNSLEKARAFANSQRKP